MSLAGWTVGASLEAAVSRRRSAVRLPWLRVLRRLLGE